MRRVELPALTGIRFYAALFVFLSHVLVIPGVEGIEGRHLVFNAGVVGVSLFFVLSGFILTYNYTDIFRDGVSGVRYRQFVWDRLTKIYPVQFATFLMVLPIAVLSPQLPLDWRAVPIHLLLLQCWWPAAHPMFHHFLNVPSWSISCEWFFYLLAPIAMFFALGRGRRSVLVLLVVAYACGLGFILGRNSSEYSRLYFVSWFAPSRFIEFLVGVFAARIFIQRRPSVSPTYAMAAQMVGLVLIVIGARYRAEAPWPLWGGLLYAPGAALLIFGLATGYGRFAAHLGSRWLERLGMASFSFYMVHAPILRALRGVCLHFGWEVRSWASFAATVVGIFVFVQTVAFVLYYLYERPAQKWLRSWMRAEGKPRLGVRTVFPKTA